MPRRGVCKLCLDEKELQESHFIPAGILSTLREATISNPNPVSITSTIALQTSKPIINHVFCRACEGILNKNGENWVVRLVANGETFPLNAIIREATPSHKDAEIAIYAGSGIKGLRTEALAYFALSIFWRRAAHRWTAIESIPEVELGPYQEPARRFLLGETQFPDNVAVSMTVWPAPPILRAVVLPFRQDVNTAESGFRCFRFYVPGIEFWLFTGRIPNHFRKFCLYSSTERFFTVSKTPHGEAAEFFRHAMNIARPSAKLRKFLSGPDPRKAR